MPRVGATDWIAPNSPVPEGRAGSRKTAARLTAGATSLSSSSHFPPKLYSKDMKLVALPPGRAKLSTKPAATGSPTVGNTTGTVWVACSVAPTVEAPWATITSGASAANSAACRRISSALAVAQRVSICTLETLQESAEADLKFPIVRTRGQENADEAHLLALLRARRERPRSRRAAEKCDELAPPLVEHAAFL